jgi:hypothetical protein
LWDATGGREVSSGSSWSLPGAISTQQAAFTFGHFEAEFAKEFYPNIFPSAREQICGYL